MSAPAATFTIGPPRRISFPEVPAPDTREGRALIVSMFTGVAFLLLLVAVNTPLADRAASWVPLVLILATVLSLALSSRLLTDRSNVRTIELELARTVSVHSAAGQLPDPAVPLGKVLREYVRTADEMRRHWRTDAYAAGPAMVGAFLALGSAIFWGLGFSTGTIWLGYLAVVVELPALTCLTFSVSVLALGIGQERAVSAFAALTPRRWRSFSERNPALDEAVAGIPWLDAFARELREGTSLPASKPGPWSGSRSPTA